MTVNKKRNNPHTHHKCQILPNSDAKITREFSDQKNPPPFPPKAFELNTKIYNSVEISHKNCNDSFSYFPIVIVNVLGKNTFTLFSLETEVSKFSNSEKRLLTHLFQFIMSLTRRPASGMTESKAYRSVTLANFY